MATNVNLQNAKNNRKDEFYTQFADVADELKHYSSHFKGKTVYCNCDNPMHSAFWRYFHLNFSILGLKRLIASYYHKEKLVYAMKYEGGDDSDITIGIKSSLKGNGDFRSQECTDLLQSCNIVVTNPPFSLFREYVAQLMQYNKQFLIIGNMNAITYKEFFPLIKENCVWMGASIHSGDREFAVSDDYPLYSAGYRVDEDGCKYIKVKGVRWWTNLDYEKRHVPLNLNEKYYGNENQYSEYVHYNAINIDRTMAIPCDYDGVMGVPISFLDKYCPEQFEIVGFPRRYASVKQNSSAECGLITGAKQTICTDGRSIAIRHRR